MLFFAFGASLYVLLAGIDNGSEHDNRTSPSPIRIDLSQLPASNPQRITWSGGGLILIRRDKAQLESLTGREGRLEDPQSLRAQQPDALPSPARSLRPDIFLAYDRGTDMGCPLNWMPPGHRDAPLQPWPGGFRDNCRGSWYDAAGRVLRDQEAKRNLDIPPHRYSAENLLEVGGSGDNAAPVN